MANEFIARNGLISQNNSVVTGSLTVTQGITGSFFGTSSVSTNIIVTADSTTNATFYPIFSPSGSGAVGAKVDNPYLTYNPSTKVLTTGDINSSYFGNRTLTVQASSIGGTEIKLLPSTNSGYARINVGNTAQPLDFQMNSVDVMRIAQDGKVGIGTTGATAKLEVRGSGINSSTTAFLIQNGTLSSLLKVLDDGTVTAGPNAAFIISSSGTTFLNNTANALNIISTQATALTVAGGSNSNNIATFKSDDTNETLAYITTNGSIFTTASITATQGITGSLFGTSSWAVNSSQAISSSFTTTSSYASNGGVTQIVAGTNVTISPTNGLGTVTINSTGGGGSGGTDLGLVQAMTVGLQNIF